TADARPDAVIERMEPHESGGRTTAYIAHLAGGGFCLCGADDLVLPVYLYSPTGTYDPEIPDYDFILWEIAGKLENLEVRLEGGDPDLLQYRSALRERAAAWQDLISGQVPPRRELKNGGRPGEPPMVVLPLTSRWHQGQPYYDQCPVLTPPSENVVVGCVATAMSQVMYYWKWPLTGEGDGSVDYHYRFRTNWDEEPLAVDPFVGTENIWTDRLEWTSASGGRLRMNGFWDETVYEYAQVTDSMAITQDYLDALESLWNRLTETFSTSYANPGGSSYNWSLMKDNHNDGMTEPGDAEVAKLCHHAGVMAGMNYGLLGSGALMWGGAGRARCVGGPLPVSRRWGSRIRFARPEHRRHHDRDHLFLSGDLLRLSARRLRACLGHLRLQQGNRPGQAVHDEHGIGWWRCLVHV
ncbi:MAG: C10 family peptidase, partial [Candidatus Eisenbacteria bacterium]